MRRARHTTVACRAGLAQRVASQLRFVTSSTTSLLSLKFWLSRFVCPLFGADERPAYLPNPRPRLAPVLDDRESQDFYWSKSRLPSRRHSVMSTAGEFPHAAEKINGPRSRCRVCRSAVIRPESARGGAGRQAAIGGLLPNGKAGEAGLCNVASHLLRG